MRKLGNGKQDIVACNYGQGQGNTISVLMNTTPTGSSTPTFAPQVTYTVGAGVLYATAVDLNGDGKLDLVTANSYDGTVSILLNNGNGTFATAVTTSVGTNPHCVQVVTIGGTKYMLVCDANDYGTGDLMVLKNTGSATFYTETQTYDLSAYGIPNPRDLVTGDFNGDGKLDVAVIDDNVDGINSSTARRRFAGRRCG